LERAFTAEEAKETRSLRRKAAAQHSGAAMKDQPKAQRAKMSRKNCDILFQPPARDTI
jgi:hypothetical protein